MVQLSTLATLAAAIVGVHSYGAQCPDNKCAKNATPYCSSYLGVPAGKTVTSSTTSTSTSTITKYTSTQKVAGKPTTITSTVTVPTTETTTVTATSSTETQSTVVVAPTCMASAAVPDVGNALDPAGRRKRDYGYGQPHGQPAKPTKPACMSAYKERADVTKACKCLNIKPTVSTVQKTATITSTTTVKKCKEITTAPTVTSTTTIAMGETTMTVTTTTTSTKTLDPTTITSGDIAIPTSFMIISSGADTVVRRMKQLRRRGPVLTNGLYAAVSVASDESNPINFASALPDTATIFSLGEEGELTIPQTDNVFDTVANFVPTNDDGSIPDPRLITYGPDGDQTVPVICAIVPSNDGTCALTCGNSGFDTETAYVCSVANTYYIGSGSSTSTNGATCVPFVPLVVDAE